MKTKIKIQKQAERRVSTITHNTHPELPTFPPLSKKSGNKGNFHIHSFIYQRLKPNIKVFFQVVKYFLKIIKCPFQSLTTDEEPNPIFKSSLDYIRVYRRPQVPSNHHKGFFLFKNLPCEFVYLKYSYRLVMKMAIKLN